MSMLFAYMAGGEGVGVRIFLLAVWGGGGGVRFSTSPSVKKKITESTPINKWL